MSIRRRPTSPVRKPLLEADERRIAATQGLPPGRTKHYPPGGIHMTSGEWKLLFVVVLVAFAVRLFRLSYPTSVVFDEVHFGKFASKYIKTQYFMDVHPPLAKLLITFAGFVFGYDGHFDFKDIGKEYDDGVPYFAMRLLPALLGIATIPISYITLRALDCRAPTALLAALFITFENGLITQSRLILLDSPLVFFTALTVLFWVGFCNEDKHEPFTETWWAWLTLSGLSLGAVLSSKWVGLFTVATVGISTLQQLWTLLGDLRVSPRLWIRHFIARAICLIAVPISFYMLMFSIHFSILNSSGDGDGFMSSEFQHTLSGRGMADTYADVAVGSTVTIRHVNTQGGYLHSHPHNYPGGSKQQQITLYPHRDSNNEWRIYNASADNDAHDDYDYENQPLLHITPGMRIKLFHISTEKRLHSHDIRPPVSEVDFQNEISAYGMPGFMGDMNDDWFVEIHQGSPKDRESSKRLRTLRTQFRLRHALTGCYLFSHKVKLPEWGFEQQEVTCNKNAVKDNSLWFIETATHPNLPKDAEKVNYKLPGFFSKFWELQAVMWNTNAGLTDRHTYDSRPSSWPWLRRGINFWVKDNRQIYLIGNPFVWWLSSFAVFMYVLVRGFMILRAKRGCRDFDNTKIVKYESLCTFLLTGWALHYFPFFLMARQLFLHHYFPALYFAILLLSACFDFLTSTLRPRVRLQITLVLILGAIITYAKFNPLVYGSVWTKDKCRSAQWLKTWDFSCNDFKDSYSDYDPQPVVTSKVPVAQTTIVDDGRAPIVVDDPAIKNAVAGPGSDEEGAEQDTTTLAHGKPEPGHDIFAGKAEKDQAKASTAGSDAAPLEERKKGVEEKEISLVVTAATAAEEVPSQSVEKVEEPKKVAADASSVKEDSKPEDGPVKGKAAGPKGEAELEAEKVAAELYPSAVGLD